MAWFAALALLLLLVVAYAGRERAKRAVALRARRERWTPVHTDIEQLDIEPRDSVEAVLREQLGESALSRLNAADLAAIQAIVLNDARGKAARERLIEYFPEGSVTWSPHYEAYYERRASGRRIRLTKHQCMVEGLMGAVGKQCMARFQASRPRFPHITPYVLFRAELGFCEPACEPMHGRYWPIIRARDAYLHVFACRRPDCRCWARPCDVRSLDHLRSTGVAVHQAAVAP